MGLPTIEEQRSRKARVAYNMLELHRADSDIVVVGDVDLSEKGWQELKWLSDGVIPLKAKLNEGYENLYGKIGHERPDSSEYIIRAEESRGWYKNVVIPAENTIACEAGYICIGNDNYLRYKGEIEICRMSRPADEKVNVIGKVDEGSLEYLPFIEKGMGFVLVK